MRRKNITKATVICYSITATLWTILAAIKCYEQSYSMTDKVLAGCLALVWIVCAVEQYKRYRKEKES